MNLFLFIVSMIGRFIIWSTRPLQAIVVGFGLLLLWLWLSIVEAIADDWKAWNARKDAGK